MKKIVSVLFLLAPLLNAAAQQEYFIPPQLRNTFVYGGMWFRQTGDTTAEVREDAFYGLPVQRPLVIPSTVLDSTGSTYTVTRIGSRAFENMNISGITLPNTLREIGENAFAGNDSLLYIELPAGLRRIEGYAFGDCPLEGVVILPDSMEYINPLAFRRYILNTQRVGVTGYAISGNPRFCTVDGILYNSDTTELLMAPDVVADTFHVPTHVRQLGDCSLLDCGAMSVVLNDNLREIGMSVFDSRVTNVTIPASVCRIDGKIFGGNVAAHTVTVDSASLHYKIVDRMLLSYNGDTLVMVYGVWYGAKELPEGIRVICPNTFNGITSISRISLPSTLEEVGDYGLRCGYCEFEFPQNLRKIGNRAIGASYTNLTLPNSLTDIADYAFAETVIDTITFGDSLRVIPRGVMYGCNSLKRINLGRNVEHIMPEAFAASYSAPQLKIDNDYMPETLRTIGRDAFRGRTIARVKFHNNPDTVGEYAFNSVQRVFFEDTVPPVVYDSSFKATCDVYVPCRGAAIFGAAPGWGTSFHYIESPCPPTAVDEPAVNVEPFSVTVVGDILHVERNEPLEVGVYDILGRCLLHSHVATESVHFRAPAAGLYIVRAGTAAKKLVVK